MSAIPVAVPVVWTADELFFLQSGMFRFEIGSDCLRHRGFFR